MVVLAFMQIYIVAEGDNFVAAMRKSWRLTEGSRLSLFLLGAVVVGISFGLGAVLGIGTFVVALAGVNQAVPHRDPNRHHRPGLAVHSRRPRQRIQPATR